MTFAAGGAAPSGIATKVGAAAGGLVLLVALLGAGAGAGIASLLGGGGSAPSGAATAQIPPGMLALYQRAAATCPGLPWTVLAGIGTVESDNGQSTLPGVRSGLNAAGLAAVIYRWVGGLRHVRDSVFGRRACGVSASCEVRGAGGDGHTRSLGCPGCDGLLSGVACGVSF